MNTQTLKMMQVFTMMESTIAIAKAFDEIISEVGCASSSLEIVACVVMAQLRSGKGEITWPE